jgi:7-keto-8-aminopelargonate synthetase-like enzyme
MIPSESRTSVSRAASPLIPSPRADSRWSQLERLRTTSPMFDAVIDEVRGRRIRIGDKWLIDFASCNYLGFDLDEEIIAAVEPAIRRWGTHPSWSRLLGNPRPYIDIEDRLTELLGAPDTLVLPTITHIHMSALPAMAGRGWLFLDAQAHKTIYDGCMVARGAGATIRRYPTNDVQALADLLRDAPTGVTKLICMDGVNSMTGNYPDLQAFAELAGEHEALIYVDDAHGFGVIGERSPEELSPYGSRGNSIVRHADVPYDNVILVGGFSKAYSSLLAFLALPTKLKDQLKVAAAPYLYSGPSPVASLATVLAGLAVNETRGDEIRADLYRKTAKVLNTVRTLGLATPNESGAPVIELPLANPDDIDAVGDFLFHAGIYVTLAAYPLVPRSEVGFRVQVTAANSDDEVEELCAALRELAERFELQRSDGAVTTGSLP